MRTYPIGYEQLNPYGLHAKDPYLQVGAISPDGQEHLFGIYIGHHDPQSFKILGVYNEIKRIHGFEIYDWDVRLKSNNVLLPKGSEMDSPSFVLLSDFTSLPYHHHNPVITPTSDNFNKPGPEISRQEFYAFLDKSLKEESMKHKTNFGYDDVCIMLGLGSLIGISGASVAYLINLPSVIAVTSPAVVSTLSTLGTFGAVFGTCAVAAGLAGALALKLKEPELSRA